MGICRECGRKLEGINKKWGWICSDCIRIYQREWARKRRELGFKIGGNPPPKQWWADYRARPEVKKRNEARYKSSNAYKKGIIKKSPCSNCGENKSEMHHSDYDKPLQVIWLCKKCHLEEHIKLNQKAEV